MLDFLNREVKDKVFLNQILHNNVLFVFSVFRLINLFKDRALSLITKKPGHFRVNFFIFFFCYPSAKKADRILSVTLLGGWQPEQASFVNAITREGSHLGLLN